MSTYVVHFIEDSYASNEKELHTSPGERHIAFFVDAMSAEEAYLIGVSKAREKTNRTFRLNSCKLREGK